LADEEDGKEDEEEEEEEEEASGGELVFCSLAFSDASFPSPVTVDVADAAAAAADADTAASEDGSRKTSPLPSSFVSKPESSLM